MVSFGQFIKTEREKREWTQTEFGEKLVSTPVLLVVLKIATKNSANRN